MQTLLIYEMIPENSSMHLIPDAPDWLLKCHGLYGNSDELSEAQWELLNRVGDAICSDKRDCGNPEGPWATLWTKFQIGDEVAPVLTGETLVVKCGFYL